MDLDKEFELYRKLEVMAFRYFRMAEFLEICLKTNLKLKDELGTILDPKGYRKLSFLEGNKYFKGSIHIPHNPFYNNTEDQQLWRTIYPEDFTWVTNTKKDIVKAYQEVWRRINEIKFWLGITKDTQFCGIRLESRLTTLLENLLRTNIPEFRYDFEFTIFYEIDRYTIQRFLRVMKNRSRKGRVIQLIK